MSFASGASFASVRSTATPPNHANIEPPRNACARLFSSMPSKIAIRVTSSLSSSPREGRARFASAAAVAIPAQAPSSKITSVRKSRI